MVFGSDCKNLVVFNLEGSQRLPTAWALIVHHNLSMLPMNI